MSLSLLLEKYDVSTEEGLQKALREIEKEESEVDDALSGILSKSCTLEGRLRTASQAYTKLGEVKTDAQSAADMVEKTAGLARDVSAKVRQLDLARSRVAECQLRVHDLIDLQLCSAGVEAAIKAHDYETGAAHVSRFLSMDPGSVAAAQARGAGDPRDAMMKAANTLREHIVHKFEEAARKEDEASIERLFKILPQIGKAEEGVDLLAKYLAGQAEAQIRRACVVAEVRSEAAVFADALTRAVEAGGAAVERARLVAGPAAPGLLSRAIAIIQPQVCSGGRRVAAALVAARVPPPGEAPPPARAVEPALAELALAHSRLHLYFNFLRRKTEADASTLDEAKRKACSDAVEKIINECDLMRTAQDLLGHYLELERYFLEESVNKALKMAAPQAGVSTSSLVDDVFFIARKVIRRSVCSGSVEGACVMLNSCSCVLERDVCSALRRALRAPPAAPLAPLAPPPPPAHERAPPAPPPALSALQARRDSDLEAQRLLYLAHMNEAEAGAEWAERLARSACASAEPLCRSRSERDKLRSCAAELAGAAAAFRAAHEGARAAVLAELHRTLAAWADRLAAPATHPDEMEEDADALPQALEQWMESNKLQLSAATAEALVHSALHEICERASRLLLQYHYTRESGLQVERRARRLAAWAGGALWAGGGRGAGARLAAAAALLALEHAHHAQDTPAPAHAHLSARDIADLLARRVDFKIEDIKRLKL